VRRIFASGLYCLALLSAACGTPVPEDKKTYVGEWRSPSTYLLITPDGRVEYKRVRGATSKSINAPLKTFLGQDFVVGVGPLSTTFKVSKPPYQDSARWKMVVDGVELTKQ